VIIHRALSVSNRRLDGTSNSLLLCFGLMIILSGLFSFMVDKTWFASLSPVAKIPMYSLIGISISFALTFAFVDCINFYYDMSGRNVNGAAPLHASSQICALIIGSLSMGLVFGVFFGYFDVEDDTTSRDRLTKNRHICTPLAGVVGLLTALIVRRLGRTTHTRPEYYSVKGEQLESPDDEDTLFGDDTSCALHRVDAA